MTTEVSPSFPGLPNVLINYNTLDKKLWDEFAALTVQYEKWNYETEYFNNFRKAFGQDDMQFVTAIEEETKKPMGCVFGTYWRNCNNERVLYTIGTFFIVPDYRGKQLGNYLFDYLNQKALNEKIPLYLCAVVGMGEKYSKYYGFSLFRDYLIETFAPKLSHFTNKREITLSNYSVYHHSEFTHWDKFLQFDLKLTNGVVNRIKYLRILFDNSVYSSIVTNNHGDVVGCVSMREMTNGMLTVGPFYAENKDVVQFLLNKVLENVDTTKYDSIRFKAFTCNKHLKDLLSLYTGDKLNQTATATLQFSGTFIPTEEKYLYCIVDSAQNFV
uniref:N-acetyltransferase domain-containing protein n=1 Tax=Rhabditophanes sp. KR3021 TaxID=114890 RepID=A0AC35U9S9_9BILA